MIEEEMKEDVEYEEEMKEGVENRGENITILHFVSNLDIAQVFYSWHIQPKAT